MVLNHCRLFSLTFGVSSTARVEGELTSYLWLFFMLLFCTICDQWDFLTKIDVLIVVDFFKCSHSLHCEIHLNLAYKSVSFCGHLLCTLTSMTIIRNITVFHSATVYFSVSKCE